MNLASFLVSLAALVAVVVIGVRTLGQGERSAKSSEQSAAASVRSAVASERAARIAEGDALLRRLEGLMDVVLQMRELFNDQVSAHDTMWVPGYGAPETLARTALMRLLEGRLVLFPERFGAQSSVAVLTTTHLWTSTYLEGAIEEIKAALREAGALPELQSE